MSNEILAGVLKMCFDDYLKFYRDNTDRDPHIVPKFLVSGSKTDSEACDDLIRFFADYAPDLYGHQEDYIVENVCSELLENDRDFYDRFIVGLTKSIYEQNSIIPDYTENYSVTDEYSIRYGNKEFYPFLGGLVRSLNENSEWSEWDAFW